MRASYYRNLRPLSRQERVMTTVAPNGYSRSEWTAAELERAGRWEAAAVQAAEETARLRRLREALALDRMKDLEALA